MIAKHDVTVEDAAGLQRKVFAGQRVPVELEGVYRQAASEVADNEPKAKAETGPELDKAERGPEVTKGSRRAK